MTRLLDYSAGQIPGAAIKAAGFDGCIRYVDDPAVGLNRKHINPVEYRDLIAAGVQVLLVFEVDIGDALGGYAQGAAYAKRARTGADWIGYPAGAPIFFACDEHLTAAQIPTALAYLDGASSVLGKAAVGGYGFWEFVDAGVAGGHATWWWQCGIAPDATDPVHLWQRNDGYTTVGGISCDINELLRPIAQEDDLTPEQDAMLRDVHEQLGGSGARTPGQFPGWATLDGTNRKLTLVDLLREAHRETNQRIPNRVDGKSSDTVLGYAANADAYGYKVAAALAAIEGALSKEEADLLAAVKGVQTAAVDVQALAASLAPVIAPLLPKSATPDEFVAALAAHLAK